MAELGIWCELYRIAREPIAVTAADETSPAPRSEATASERSYICGFGDFNWAQGAAPKVFRNQRKRSKARPQNQLS